MDASIVANNFIKVLIVAQRAKQLQKGGRPLIEMPGTRATRIAIEEFDRGLIDFEFINGESQDEGALATVDSDSAPRPVR
ncbi:MAG: DNA-directed RNA polymerase subunit omega [Acidobacteriota bacterium]|nr:MAG: DNA-directed RNA polymerase subunit omega [Acidobacteriota bacterium]